MVHAQREASACGQIFEHLMAHRVFVIGLRRRLFVVADGFHFVFAVDESRFYKCVSVVRNVVGYVSVRFVLGASVERVGQHLQRRFVGFQLAQRNDVGTGKAEHIDHAACFADKTRLVIAIVASGFGVVYEIVAYVLCQHHQVGFANARQCNGQKQSRARFACVANGCERKSFHLPTRNIAVGVVVVERNAHIRLP